MNVEDNTKCDKYIIQCKINITHTTTAMTSLNVKRNDMSIVLTKLLFDLL